MLRDHCNKQQHAECTTVCSTLSYDITSLLFHLAPRSITQLYIPPRNTTQHHATPRSITQHHAASRSITQHHAAPRSITQHHTLVTRLTLIIREIQITSYKTLATRILRISKLFWVDNFRSNYKTCITYTVLFPPLLPMPLSYPAYVSLTRKIYNVQPYSQ